MHGPTGPQQHGISVLSSTESMGQTMECIGSGVECMGTGMGFGLECMGAQINSVGQTIECMDSGVERMGPAIEHMVPAGMGACSKWAL